jgi:MoxR-like ATPase
VNEGIGRFGSGDDVVERLASVGYLADPTIGLTVYIADRLEKPVLLEGPAGVGKTELARSVAMVTGARLIRLQCYEGLDESKALYEWNYKKQLLRIQADERRDAWSELEDDIFSEPFLLSRPLLAAIRADEPVVLLIDEIDRVEVEAEALMLEILADFQVTIPELGTVVASRRPMVFLTSNDSRDLSEALKRRCLFLHIGYPTPERERDILLSRVDGLDADLATQVAAIVRRVRQLDLKKPPSISESIDWARTLVLLGASGITDAEAPETLHVLLKYEADIAKTTAELLGQAVPSTGREHIDTFRRPESRGA